MREKRDHREISSVLRAALVGTGGEYELADFEMAVRLKYGTRAPFAQLLKDRQRHGKLLLLACKKLRVPAPQDPHGGLTCPTTWLETLASERSRLLTNVRLYDRLLALSSLEDRDIRYLLRSLRQETLQVHLPLLPANYSGSGKQG